MSICSLFYFVKWRVYGKIFYMNFDINSLNEEQKKALYETEGVVIVSAGAGSGKTRLLTHRICYLLQKGVSPYSILAITFTNKAANEMKERISQMTNQNIWISTFHSMCVRILRNEIDAMPEYDKNFTIIDDGDQEKIIKDIIKKYQCDDDLKSQILNYISSVKNSGGDFEDFFAEIMKYDHRTELKTIKKICFEYDEYLRKNNSLDFDDLLIKTLFLFNNYPNILQKYAQRFEYILVDEFQDTNLVQYKIVKKLASVHKNLFVVGDEDQCIYTWRGANFQNIFSLQKDFENVKVFKLERNYRSTKNILNLANNVILNNTERMKKNLWTEQDMGDKPVVYSAYDERDEAMFVCRNILELLSQGYSYSDFAVLMRVNALSKNFEDAFLMCGIPYKIYGGFKFYERAEVKTVLAYLNLFVNPRDDFSLLKIINFPKRGIGDGSISKLLEEAGEEKLYDYLMSEKFKFTKLYPKLEKFVETIKLLESEKNSLPIADFAEKVVEKFGLKKAFSLKDEEDDKKELNIDALLLSVRDFQDENEGATLSDFLANVMLRSDSDNIQEDGFVSVATIHSVKGLEFRTVFVVGLEEGIFPLARSNNSKAELEEERRLMYVAITRAKERIFFSSAKSRFMYGKTNAEKESRFLGELNIVSIEKPRVQSQNFDYSKKTEDEDNFESGFKKGDKVEHTRFGIGKIVDISSDGYVGEIDFEDFGRKSLMLNLANLTKVVDDE